MSPKIMKAKRAPTGASFEFRGYRPRTKLSTSPDPDLHVAHNTYWSYCGPLLVDSKNLPANFHEWALATLSGSLLPRLMPFLRFANGVLKEHGLDHYWLTIRATKATSEFDKPRWHTDNTFFAPGGGGFRVMQRQSEGSGTLGWQTDWKVCTALLGPPTMFIPSEHQAEARRTQRATKRALETEHDCNSIRCIACAATSDAVREQLAVELEPMGVAQAAPGECAFFGLGHENGAMHSEPCMSGGDRIFVNIVPGKENELKSLVAKWGMESFPRSWWIAPNLPMDRQASLQKY
ncbi:hypothetical protein SAMD00023353_0501030 [Rosellinia necatrix]|uniref:Uncharacterized protein n=1 Tax=Rosellinia necatrix TaxID=77044 RepID=A0A1S7UKA8_ROSNE|nr:hypothetical protein SAMD00023353_0501030 [Rosellinia necatrix]